MIGECSAVTEVFTRTCASLLLIGLCCCSGSKAYVQVGRRSPASRLCFVRMPAPLRCGARRAPNQYHVPPPPHPRSKERPTNGLCAHHLVRK